MTPVIIRSSASNDSPATFHVMDEPARTHTGLICPHCKWEWRDVPQPVPVLGYQPMRFTCPNRHCRRRHWIICWRLVWRAGLQLIHVATVPSRGRTSDEVRATLRQIPELDEETIDFAIAVMELSPERAGKPASPAVAGGGDR